LKNAKAESKIALFLDFDNIAITSPGRRKTRFEIAPVLERLLEKGKILVKRAYADWSNFSKEKDALHEAGLELIEIPKRKISGKNSADIRMVVDALELAYAKEHIDTFVIVSGDSDFAPLVAKLRENDRWVVGMGMKESTGELLLTACDEFIFLEDLQKGRASVDQLAKVPKSKQKVFGLLLSTVRALLREGREELYSSLIKDTMKRKRPSFNEETYGYNTFGDLLEDAASRGLIQLSRDQKAGGTFVVTGLKK